MDSNLSINHYVYNDQTKILLNLGEIHGEINRKSEDFKFHMQILELLTHNVLTLITYLARYSLHNSHLPAIITYIIKTVMT